MANATATATGSKKTATPRDSSKPKKAAAPRLDRSSARNAAIIRTMRDNGGKMTLDALLRALKGHTAFQVADANGGNPVPDPLLSKIRLHSYFKALSKATEKNYKAGDLTDEQYANFPQIVKGGSGGTAIDISELAELLS